MVAYQVSLHPNRLEMTVSMQLDVPRAADGSISLEIPKWVPGDYDFEPYGRDVFSVAATDSQGNPLSVTRRGFNGFSVAAGRGPVTVTYRAACYEPDLGDAMGLVDTDYAVLMGTRYLFCPDYLGTCSVDYGELPAGWAIHHPSGAKRAGDSNKWTYPSFEVLLDTPVCFGTFAVMERNLRGTPFYFVFVDQGIAFDAKVDAFVDQVADAALCIHDVFGLFPFEDYTFVLSLNPQADWGLEHLTSNMSSLGPEVFVDENLHATGVRVCAHELFHAWNVRRLRPAPLGQLCHHLSSGSFTEGLWVAEGFTRYYEFLIATRAKAYSADQFFSAIAGYYQHLSQQPAYRRVSATDSSLATYMNHSKYPGRVNNAIDYYDKGMLIAFGLDSRLRDANNKGDFHSLDAAFREFYLKFFGSGDTVPADYVGYTTEDVINFFEEVQEGLGPVLREQVTAFGGLDTIEQFTKLGFRVVERDLHCLGIFFLNDGAPEVYGVADDGAAGEAGLAPKDVIHTVNGFAYSEKGLAWAASQAAPVTLEVLRGHRKLELTLQPRPFRKLDHLVWEGTEDQACRIQEWLGVDAFAPDAGQRFDLDFYDNFHGVETMY